MTTWHEKPGASTLLSSGWKTISGAYVDRTWMSPGSRAQGECCEAKFAVVDITAVSHGSMGYCIVTSARTRGDEDAGVAAAVKRAL